MLLTDLDPVILRSEARKCRRLAETLESPGNIIMLGRLALEFEALATEAESARTMEGRIATGRVPNRTVALNGVPEVYRAMNEREGARR